MDKLTLKRKQDIYEIQCKKYFWYRIIMCNLNSDDHVLILFINMFVLEYEKEVFTVNLTRQFIDSCGY